MIVRSYVGVLDERQNAGEKETVSDPYGEGFFRRLNGTKAAAIFIEAIIGVAIQRLFSNATTPIDDDVRLIKEIMLRGIGMS
ncbi:MAG: hypothetical protein JRC86_02725 [Deltaproteobacteria bacterium]|nr:hypothetical protein [Deltaproteobacteria bacterium]